MKVDLYMESFLLLKRKVDRRYFIFIVRGDNNELMHYSRSHTDTVEFINFVNQHIRHLLTPPVLKVIDSRNIDTFCDLLRIEIDEDPKILIDHINYIIRINEKKYLGLEFVDKGEYHIFTKSRELVDITCTEEEIELGNVCVICMSNKICVTLRPCAHTNICIHCVNRLFTMDKPEDGVVKCPVCKCKVTEAFGVLL
jgi:hypothetical protein